RIRQTGIKSNDVNVLNRIPRPISLVTFYPLPLPIRSKRAHLIDRIITGNIILSQDKSPRRIQPLRDIEKKIPVRFFSPNPMHLIATKQNERKIFLAVQLFDRILQEQLTLAKELVSIRKRIGQVNISHISKTKRLKNPNSPIRSQRQRNTA